MNEQWHSLSPDEALYKLNSRRSGLNNTEVVERLYQYGPNELKGKKKTPPMVVFLRQFLSPLIYVLLVAVIVSAIVEHYIDAGVIMGVLLLNAVIGFVQETQAEKAMEALMEMAAPHAKVRRQGIVKSLLARKVVPGDILLVETGDKIPADVKSGVDAKMAAARSALSGSDIEQIKRTAQELSQELQKVGAAVYQQQQDQQQAGPTPAGEEPPSQEPGEDSVEGEFREV